MKQILVWDWCLMSVHMSGEITSNALSLGVISTNWYRRAASIHYLWFKWLNFRLRPKTRSIVLSYFCVLQSISCANWLLNNLFCVFTSGLGALLLKRILWEAPGLCLLMAAHLRGGWPCARSPSGLFLPWSMISPTASWPLPGAMGKVQEAQLLIMIPGCNQRLAASLCNYAAHYRLPGLHVQPSAREKMI